MSRPHEMKPFRAVGGPAKFELAEAGPDGKPKLARFSGNAYTGAVMRPNGWFGNLILDLKGAKIPSQHRPILHQHDHEQLVGHSESVKVDSDGVKVEGVFSGQAEHTEKVTDPASKGFQWQMSVGGNPIRLEHLEAGEETEVNGRTVTGPLEIAREWELGEVSFVKLGADGDTSVSVSASKGGKPVKEFSADEAKATLKGLRKLNLARYSDEEIDEMDDATARAKLKRCMAEDDGAEEERKKKEKDEKAKAKASAEEEEEKKTEARIAKAAESAAAKAIEATRKAVADETERTSFIAGIARQYGISTIEVETDGKKSNVDFVAHSVRSGWSKEKIELEAMRQSRPGAGVGQGNNGPLVYSTSNPEVTEAVLECAALDALRHSYRLEHDDFYFDKIGPDKVAVRRVPQHIEAETKREIKSRYTDQVRDNAHRAFRGRVTLHQLLDMGFRAMGLNQRWNWKTQEGIQAAMMAWDTKQRNAITAEGASDISVGNILANVLNKFALQGYLFEEQAWRKLAGIRPVPDFKATKSVALLGDVIFKMFGATGELENFSLQDQAFPNQAFPFGRMGTIPWKTLVDDDLSILQTVPQKVGQGWGLAINDFFWSLMSCLVNAGVITGGTAGNPNGNVQVGMSMTADDGNAFFRTSSNLPSGQLGLTPSGYYGPNKTTGAGSALSATSLQTMKENFDLQVDPNGNPLGYDQAKPILLFGPSNWQTAQALLVAGFIQSGNTSNAFGIPDKNVWADYAEPVMSRYIENTNYLGSIVATGQWFLFFNPVALAAIEIAFLNGIDTPAVLTAGPDYQFDRPGISIRGTGGFGVTQQNFRAVAYAKGS